jgi:hypothetical protein
MTLVGRGGTSSYLYEAFFVIDDVVLELLTGFWFDGD